MKTKIRRIGLVLGGVLSYPVNAQLTRHKAKVFKRFETSMREECVKREIEPFSRLHNAALYRAAILAAQWLAENNPKYFTYQADLERN